jgi:signal transduction histidine kinase
MLARQQAISKAIDIDLKKNPSLPEVEHDSDQIHQVLLNLLLNSIQAIDRKGTITVALDSEEDEVLISVSDTGRGISSEHLPNIFRPFYTTKGNGTGLGLSLAKRIVEEHNGHIDVTSSIGRGTEFVVTLPMRRTVLQAVAG